MFGGISDSAPGFLHKQFVSKKKSNGWVNSTAKLCEIQAFHLIRYYTPASQHNNGKWTRNEDVLPIEHGDIPLSC